MKLDTYALFIKWKWSRWSSHFI